MKTMTKKEIFGELIKFVRLQNRSLGSEEVLLEAYQWGKYIRAIVDVVDNLPNCGHQLFNAAHDVDIEWTLLVVGIQLYPDQTPQIDRLEKAILCFREEWQKQFK